MVKIYYRFSEKPEQSICSTKNDWNLEIKINYGNKIGALIMDLSKALETINHNICLSKLKAYGFKENFVSFIRK